MHDVELILFNPIFWQVSIFITWFFLSHRFWINCWQDVLSRKIFWGCIFTNLSLLVLDLHFRFSWAHGSTRDLSGFIIIKTPFIWRWKCSHKFLSDVSLLIDSKHFIKSNYKMDINLQTNFEKLDSQFILTKDTLNLEI